MTKRIFITGAIAYLVLLVVLAVVVSDAENDITYKGPGYESRGD